MRNRAIPTAAFVVLASSIAGGLFASRVTAGQDRANQLHQMYTAGLAAVERDYYGIGITLGQRVGGGDVTVNSLCEGSPASRAGFRRGDVIARVGKEEV